MKMSDHLKQTLTDVEIKYEQDCECFCCLQDPVLVSAHSFILGYVVCILVGLPSTVSQNENEVEVENLRVELEVEVEDSDCAKNLASYDCHLQRTSCSEQSSSVTGEDASEESRNQQTDGEANPVQVLASGTCTSAAASHGGDDDATASQAVPCYFDPQLRVLPESYVSANANKCSTSIKEKGGRILQNCGKCGKSLWRICGTCGKYRSQETDVDKSSLFCCKMCGRVCATRGGLSVHMSNVHKIKKSRECDICGETFENWKLVTKHKLSAHYVKEHACHICGKAFTTKQVLGVHLEVHSGIRRFICEYCGKTFLRNTNLCDHKISVHNAGKEALQCEHCNRRFSSKWILNTHLRQSHYLQSRCGPKRPIKRPIKRSDIVCVICRKTFTTRAVLKKHHESHAERLFQCSECPKRFRSQEAVALHEAVHNQESHFKCAICLKLYARKRNLKRHMKQTHPEHTVTS